MAERSTESPMQNRTLLLISLGLAVLAVIFVNLYVRSIRKRYESGSFYVIQAAADIKHGERIKESLVEPVRVPGTFRDAFEQAWHENDADSLRSRQIVPLVGRPLTRDVRKGEILFFADVEGAVKETPEQTITRGYRHKTIAVDSRLLPASLRPGSFVDIGASVKLTPDGVPVPMTVMSGVQVVALGRLMSAPEGLSTVRRTDLNSLTIEVRPEEAVKLQAVEDHMDGPFRLTVLNPADVRLGRTDRFNPQLQSLFAALQIGSEGEGP